MRALGAVMAALLVGGCATADSDVTAIGPVIPDAPAAPADAAPDLLGTWSGTWAGTPVTLVVSEQAEVGREGLYAGPWMIYGRQAPGLAGVLTSTIRGQAVSATAQGAVVPTPTGLMVFVSAPTTFGDQRLTLKGEGPDRLVGQGEAAFGPKGAVFLLRAR